MRLVACLCFNLSVTQLCLSLHGYTLVYVCLPASTVRSGYRLTASPNQDSMKVLYYIERELAQFPSAKMAALQRKSAQIRPVCVMIILSLYCQPL